MMKRLLKILSLAAFVTVAATGCDIDATLEGSKNKLVVGEIFVDPDGWERYTVDGQFSHFFADIPMPEITQFIYEMGVFHTYIEYMDNQIPVQEGEGSTKAKWRIEYGERVEYTETIRCSYSVGNMRIEISRSDFYNAPPEGRLNFRTVIFW
jgi:hypothetical protein